MVKKKVWMGIGAIAILGGGAYYAVPAMQDNAVMQAETVKMDDFKEMKEVKFEVLDTSAFADKNLEKWFKGNETKKGENLYFDNKYTYVLISPGEEGGKDMTIWFDGMKTTSKDNLVVGYSFVKASELGITVNNDGIRTLLVRTEGEYKTVKGVEVEKEKVTVTPPKEAKTEDVTSKEKEIKSDEPVKEEKETAQVNEAKEKPASTTERTGDKKESVKEAGKDKESKKDSKVDAATVTPPVTATPMTTEKK